MAKSKSEWTQQEFAQEIRSHRNKAKSLRARAEKHDNMVEALRKESAVMATDKLPLFQ